MSCRTINVDAWHLMAKRPEKPKARGRPKESREKVLAYLFGHQQSDPAALTASGIMSGCGLSAGGYVFNLLSQLEEDGLVERRGRTGGQRARATAWYGLTSKGQKDVQGPEGSEAMSINRLVRKAARTLKGEYRASDVAMALKAATGKEYPLGVISNVLRATQGVTWTTETVYKEGPHATTYDRNVYTNHGREARDVLPALLDSGELVEDGDQ